VLLYYPYPSDEALRRDKSPEQIQAEYVTWCERASYRSHENFTTAIDFTISPDRAPETLQLLDFGGGGGQFALVARSHLPHAEVSIVDVSDATLLESWRSFNRPIRFEDFDDDETRFDYIFMNDVFEHLSDPVGVLSRLRSKLAPDGRIFIDTPRQFWLYPLLRILPLPAIYEKLLVGTVSKAHLQIWSDQAFQRAITDAGFTAEKLKVGSALTMDADFYLERMGIRGGPLLAMGRLLHAAGRLVLRNKIFCVLR
jgi:2-polyprenyl-3-methyl-5-hydroxy-6-metoxy-1,4-benzoquinol methylase